MSSNNEFPQNSKKIKLVVKHKPPAISSKKTKKSEKPKTFKIRIPKKKDATMFHEPRFNKIKKVLSQSSEISSARHESRPIRPTRPS